MKRFYIASLLGLLLAGAAFAVTPGQLRDLLASEHPPTLIDVRSQAAFEAGSLPNAMRMNVREAAERPLADHVVFFDDGVGVNHARRAAEAFNALGKSGVQAVALRGGLAAWADVQGQTTEPGGLRPTHMHYVSYQDLTGQMVADADDIVLLDVRDTGGAAPDPRGDNVPAASATTPAAETALDLSEAFPAYAVTRSLPDAAGSDPRRNATLATDDPTPLYVLIDNGDGSAERTARRLRDAGVRRVAILIGGETIVRRRGEPGSIRRGPGVGLADPIVPRAPNEAVILETEDRP